MTKKGFCVLIVLHWKIFGKFYLHICQKGVFNRRFPCCDILFVCSCNHYIDSKNRQIQTSHIEGKVPFNVMFFTLLFNIFICTSSALNAVLTLALNNPVYLLIFFQSLRNLYSFCNNRIMQHLSVFTFHIFRHLSVSSDQNTYYFDNRN